MKRNPICKKEMRSAVRDVKIPVTITICSGILAAVALLSMYLNVAQVRVSAQIQYRSFLDLYVFVAVIGFLMLVFLMPALTAGSISGERERQTLDIMMTTMVSRWDIVSGKLLSSLAVMFLVIISMFPVLALAFVYGGISWLDVGILMICFFTSALLTGAIGIFCSALFKRSIISTVVAYSLTALVFIGTYGVNLLAESLSRMTNGGLAGMGAVSDAGSGAFLYLLLLNPSSPGRLVWPSCGQPDHRKLGAGRYGRPAGGSSLPYMGGGKSNGYRKVKKKTCLRSDAIYHHQRAMKPWGKQLLRSALIPSSSLPATRGEERRRPLMKMM